MNARVEAILEEVKALPFNERAEFARLFHEWQTVGNKSEEPTAAVEWPDFAGRMKAIFGERTILGDPQTFWDEERGREH